MKIRGVKKTVNLSFTPEGILLDVEILEDETAPTFRKYILKLKERLNLDVLVTDDHASYRESLIGTGIERRLCIVHVLKNVMKGLKKLDFSEEEKGKIIGLVRAPTGKGRIIIWEMYLKRLKERGSRDEGMQFLLRLTEKCMDLTTYERREGVPKDNNFTERNIGGTKIRYKTTRGMKSEEGLLNFLYLTQEILRGNEIGEIDLKKLIV